jgi:hypothetical protein
MATSLNLAECTPAFTTEKDFENPERMEHLTVTLTHPVLGELATVQCLKIFGRLRFKNNGDFLEMMDEESQELHEFSVGLFDRYSNIRPWLVDGGAKSGSGCWGTELSIGDMLYLEDVLVKEEVCSVCFLFICGLLNIDGFDSYLVQTTWRRLVVASENLGFVSYGI